MFKPLIANGLLLVLLAHSYCCLAALCRDSFSAKKKKKKDFEQSCITKQRGRGNGKDGVTELKVMKGRKWKEKALQTRTSIIRQQSACVCVCGGGTSESVKK